jgi:pimeloyl-ACP methyl ester carboxylesterase
VTPRVVEIVAGDGCVLRGQVWPGGPDWIVLLHDAERDEDLDCWQPLVPALLAEELSVLAVDLRGHGASDGTWSDEAAVDDIVATLRFARANGARFVATIAAGVSGVNVLQAAERELVQGAVAMSAAMPSHRPCSPPRHPQVVPGSRSPAADGGRKVEGAPRAAGTAKLFIVGANDVASREVSERLRRASIGWAAEVTFPTDEHGAALLHGVWRGHIGDQICGFVREQRFLACADARSKGVRE